MTHLHQCYRLPLFLLDEEVIISIPILSLYDVKKFPKQYLEAEKLVMLNPGIEILTTNYLSVKVSDCLRNKIYREVY